ncbi:SIR2-like protein [Sphingomonas sp. PP-F2F-A104-K0414]|uniref:SIR2 family protein n=1 Tax=Sphingomonas sp. PP-F2F-A104-K0414 TaxID=2135661 RepID=UPI001044FA18|nr:SIR2 family protein [Sphingomonas sp. PP-F2F-A104-K0414]TCP97589.1 SIR2-like protein [Sphingomonas sp. PP-F2F-A104-K0414]
MAGAATTKRFLKDYPEALISGGGAVFVGAGVSMGAGYPSWASLLTEVGEELGVKSGELHDLAALAQWSIQENGSATRVRNVIKEQIGVERPVPATLEVIARLPVKFIWTTNYDTLVERAFGGVNRPLDTVSGAADLALRAKPGATRLFKMHGSVERLDDVVISTDDYELYRSKRGAFLPLLQAHLSSMSMLFLGISFTDLNIRHVLSLIRESFTSAPPEHFAIVRPPQRDDYDTDAEFEARSTQHKHWSRDLKRYGLLVVEIDDYSEVPDLLRQVERRVAARRVWVSGSWPPEVGDGLAKAYGIAHAIGRLVGDRDRDLVSGAGLVVGSASVAGFLDALRCGGGWDLERRLVARPFPQPIAGGMPDEDQWVALRAELARIAGIVVFVGGVKIDPATGSPMVAGGVLDEFEAAKAADCFMIPIASTGGAAARISELLTGSAVETSGRDAMRPTDDELGELARADITVEEVVKLVVAILARIDKRI